jgi:hypothetical protein
VGAQPVGDLRKFPVRAGYPKDELLSVVYVRVKVEAVSLAKENRWC